MQVIKSRIPIADPNLTPKVWANTSGELHWFESYLADKYPALATAGRLHELVANPPRILAKSGERTFLPHAYYRHFTTSGRPIARGSGRWEFFARGDHSQALATFLARYFGN